MWLRLHSSVNVIYLVFVTDVNKEISLTCRVWMGKLFLQVLSSIKIKLREIQRIKPEDEYEKCVHVI